MQSTPLRHHGDRNLLWDHCCAGCEAELDECKFSGQTKLWTKILFCVGQNISVMGEDSLPLKKKKIICNRRIIGEKHVVS